MTKRWVYLFKDVDAAQQSVGGDWDATRALLGGKGANLGDMTRVGVPVPPGFTVTTEACNAYLAGGERLPDGLWDQLVTALRAVEADSGKVFGDPSNERLAVCLLNALLDLEGPERVVNGPHVGADLGACARQ